MSIHCSWWVKPSSTVLILLAVCHLLLICYSLGACVIFTHLYKVPVFILSAWVLIIVSIPFERSFPCQQGYSPPCRGCSAQITLVYVYRFYTSDFRVKSDIKYYCFRSGRREIFANYFRRVDRLHHTIVACQRRVFIALGEGVNSMSYHYHFILFFMFY